MTQLVTGEAVPVELRVARIGSRAPAALLDLLIQLVLGIALAFALRPLLSDVDGALQAALILVAYVALVLGYPVASETLWGGRTLGKAAMGLRVVRDDGGPIRFRHALVRGLIGAVVELPGVTFGLCAVIWSLCSAQGKRLGDALAGTVVIHTRVPQTVGPIPPMPPQLAGWAATLDLSRFGDDLALACRQLLGRAASLTPVSRERLGGELVAAVAATVTPPPPVGTPGWAYLAAVLAERRRREEQRRAGVPAAAYEPPHAPVYAPPGAYAAPPAYTAPPAAFPAVPAPPATPAPCDAGGPPSEQPTWETPAPGPFVPPA